MWIKVTNVREQDGRWVSGLLAETAYLPVSELWLKQLENMKEKGEQLYTFDMSKQIGIVNEEAVKIGYKLIFADFEVVNQEREQDLLEILKECNFAMNSKNRVCFNDYSKVCFEIDGNILSYDEFCRYELPEGRVFKRVFDNGYSYIGSEPFRVSAKQYADSAINAAKKIGRIWSGWQHGYRLNDVFCIDVPYGKDESYHEVSFS
jgi:hypothetical protein